jgi:hypothetical protein
MAILDQIPKHLDRCSKRQVDYPDMSEHILQAFRTHKGVDYIGRQGITFCWYPWAAMCAVQWQEYAEKNNLAEETERARQVLGHLIVDLGDGAVKKAADGWTFVASETLYCLSAVPPPVLKSGR